MGALMAAFCSRLGAAQAMARCADAMGKLSDLNDVSDAFYLEALSKCVAALRAAEHDAEGTGTKGQVADALAVSPQLLSSLFVLSLRPS